ncbi:hypothetical protein ACQKH5_15785 [Hyphomonas sp. NPDC076900]|uniref:hypothetical protein n=1 Tax=unclassified Hyphomonas TaxID=2630699 RepID=UPI003D089116
MAQGHIYRMGTCLLSGALLLAGCATPLPPDKASRLLETDGKPCPGAEQFDVASIKEKNAAEAAQREAWISEYTLETPLPPGADEAETRIRVRVPPTGMWALDTRVTLWKSADGAWQIATNNIDFRASPPPPPPPPPPMDADGNLLPGFEDWTPEPPPPPRPPYITSVLDADNTATLETILADPCFINGPDSLPYSVPLNEIDEYGREEWLCPPDSAYYMAEVKQAGLPTRYVSHSCYMDFAVSKLLTAAAYMSPSPDPETE